MWKMTQTDKLKNKQLKTTQRQQIENNELQNIIRVISHDLRTPLASAHGFSDLLVKYCKNLAKLSNKPEFKECFDKKTCEIIKNDIPQSVKYIVKSLEEMDGLIAGLTNISRAGRVKINIENLKMNKLVSQVADAIKFQTQSTHAILTIEHLPDCKADKFMLNEVFVNLIANAVKFLDPKRKGMITISGKVEDANAIYCIKDNGIGIELENQSKVFELFYREKADGNLKGEGIGLAFALRAINRLDGEIWIESEPGKGSRFFVTMPAVKPLNMPIKQLSRAYRIISDKKKGVTRMSENISCLDPL
jgi:signal transduction histidine kinase